MYFFCGGRHLLGERYLLKRTSYLPDLLPSCTRHKGVKRQ